MPKVRRSRSMDDRLYRRFSPFPSSTSSRRAPTADSVRLAEEDDKKWGDVLCPVCMEPPHNAVLLQCSSRDKGCRTFICDTSSSHSNCLDQYRKSFSEEEVDDDVQLPTDNILCPFCRGHVTGWTVIEPARKYMNAKSRSCSLESCSFTGDYGELKEHARREHPSARPSEPDPVRQQVWRSMERQRDLGDMFSVFHSSPAVMIGGPSVVYVGGIAHVFMREHLSRLNSAASTLPPSSRSSTLPPSSRSRTSFRQSF